MLQVFCNYIVISDTGVNLIITVTVNGDGSKEYTQNQSIVCNEDEPNNINFSDLKRNTSYSSFASWSSSINLKECMLSTVFKFNTTDGQGNYVLLWHFY